MLYLCAGEAWADFVDLFADVVKVDELEHDGGDLAGGLQPPVAVEGAQGQRSVQVQLVLLQLRNHVQALPRPPIARPAHTQHSL